MNAYTMAQLYVLSVFSHEDYLFSYVMFILFLLDFLLMREEQECQLFSTSCKDMTTDLSTLTGPACSLEAMHSLYFCLWRYIIHDSFLIFELGVVCSVC